MHGGRTHNMHGGSSRGVGAPLVAWGTSRGMGHLSWHGGNSSSWHFGSSGGMAVAALVAWLSRECRTFGRLRLTVRHTELTDKQQ